jgi:hypothetical protein
MTREVGGQMNYLKGRTGLLKFGLWKRGRLEMEMRGLW